MAANPYRGECEVDLGGRLRVLLFDANTVAELEEELNMGIMHMLSKEQLGLRFLRAAVFCALRRDQPRLTVEKVGEWLGATDWTNVLGIVTKALAETLPGADDVDDGDEEEGSDGEKGNPTGTPTPDDSDGQT